MKARTSGKAERTEAEQALLPLKRQFDAWRGVHAPAGARTPRRYERLQRLLAALHWLQQAQRAAPFSLAAH